MVLENLLAFGKDGILVGLQLLKPDNILLRQVEKMLVRFVDFNKVVMIGRWLFKELELRVTLLPLTQGDKEILADFSYILGRMLNDSDLCLSDFLWLRGSKPIRIWFLNLLENSL